MVDDQLFREVEEELRQERLKALWDKYGTMIVAGICAGVLVLGGVLYWRDWQVSKRQSMGDQYIEALRYSANGKNDEALKSLEELAKNGPAGYQQLSNLYIAGLKAEQGDLSEAQTLYKKVAEDPASDSILSEYAKLNLALLQLDGASYDQTKQLLSGFIVPGSAWRGIALETMALAALKSEKFEIAETHLKDIVNDKTTPVSLKRRAQILLDVIAARKAELAAG